MEENKKKVNVVTLLQKAGLTSHDQAVDPEQLRGVVVGLYFSAHWCAQRRSHFHQSSAFCKTSERLCVSLSILLKTLAGAHHAGNSPLC